MNDEELKETVGGANLDVPQGQVPLNSALEAPEEDFHGDFVSSTFASPEKLEEAQNAYGAEFAFANDHTVSDPTIPMDSAFHNLDMNQGQGESFVIGGEEQMNAFASPALDALKPSMDSESNAEETFVDARGAYPEQEASLSSFPADSVSMPMAAEEFSDFRPEMGADMENLGMEEVPQVTIENLNQEDVLPDISPANVPQYDEASGQPSFLNSVDGMELSNSVMGENAAASYTDSMQALDAPNETQFASFDSQKADTSSVMTDHLPFSGEVSYGADPVSSSGSEAFYDGFQNPVDGMVDGAPSATVYPSEGDSALGDFSPAPDFVEQTAHMQANPVAEATPIHISNDMYPPTDTAYMPSPASESTITPVDLDLEKRNRSGMRFLLIFGLIVLIFIILLPFLAKYI